MCSVDPYSTKSGSTSAPSRIPLYPRHTTEDQMYHQLEYVHDLHEAKPPHVMYPGHSIQLCSPTCLTQLFDPRLHISITCAFMSHNTLFKKICSIMLHRVKPTGFMLLHINITLSGSTPNCMFDVRAFCIIFEHVGSIETEYVGHTILGHVGSADFGQVERIHGYWCKHVHSQPSARTRLSCLPFQ